MNEHKKVQPSNTEISLEPLFNQHLQEEIMLPVMALGSYNVSIDVIYIFYTLLIHIVFRIFQKEFSQYLKEKLLMKIQIKF